MKKKRKSPLVLVPVARRSVLFLSIIGEKVVTSSPKFYFTITSYLLVFTY